MKAKEMFKELDYEYYEDDGFDVFLKATNVPDKINTEYIDFKRISFNRLSQEVSIYTYKKDALCQEFLEDGSDMKMNFLSFEELQAINQQVKELGWYE